MPCTDGGVPYPPSEEEILARKVPAMLCAVWSSLTPHQQSNALAKIDWNEAGVTMKEFTRWWKLHSDEDKRRRAREAEAQRRERLRDKALEKLTPEERRALGVK